MFLRKNAIKYKVTQHRCSNFLVLLIFSRTKNLTLVTGLSVSEKNYFFHEAKGELFAGSLEAAYSLNWGAQEIWGKGGGETLALL